MDIKNVLVCPKCRFRLTDDLECLICKRKYKIENHVYNLLESDMCEEDGKFSYWNISDDDIENAVKETEEWVADYEAHKNEQTKTAIKKLDDYIAPYLASMEGLIVDIATGRGTFLQEILRNNKKIIKDILCVDIDPQILALTRFMLKTKDGQVHYLATNGLNLAIKDNCAGFVASFVGVLNMPDQQKAINEIYRILKPEGIFFYKTIFVEENSKSYKAAKEYGIEAGITEKNLTQLLKNAGFKSVECHVIDEAVWAENPYDGLPIAGDVQKYAFVIAKK